MKDDLNLIVAQLLIFFFAGFDTTSMGFTMICHKLALYPQYQASCSIRIEDNLDILLDLRLDKS